MKAYTQSIQEVLTSSSTTPQGLSAGEAAGRLAQYGENKLAEGRRKSWLQRIWEQLRDPMILVLIAAAVISGAFGEIADMAIILVVVVLNAALGIYQENKAEQAIEALRAMSAPHSTVRRDGHLAVIPSHELVPGDIVLLEAGNAVPADLRLITAASLKIEEAALTGRIGAGRKNRPNRSRGRRSLSATGSIWPIWAPTSHLRTGRRGGGRHRYADRDGPHRRHPDPHRGGENPAAAEARLAEQDPQRRRAGHLRLHLPLHVLQGGALFDSFLTASAWPSPPFPRGWWWS